MSRILTLNIGASKATLAEYALNGKRNLTLTAYGSGDLQTVDVNDASSVAASLPPWGSISSTTPATSPSA